MLSLGFVSNNIFTIPLHYFFHKYINRELASTFAFSIQFHYIQRFEWPTSQSVAFSSPALQVESVSEKLFKERKKLMCGNVMSTIDVVVSSEDGTIIIPQAIREKLGVTSGTRFSVLAEKDMLIFKRIEDLSKKEFERLVEKGTKIAERNKIKEGDVEEITHRYRGVKVV